MKVVIGILILGVIVVFLAIGIARTQQEEEIQSINKIQQRDGVPVLTAQAEKSDIAVIRRYYGDVRSIQEASVSAKLLDRIDRIYVEVGDKVEQNQPLVRFDASANMIAIEQQRLALENARRNFERTQALWEEGAISKQLYDGAKLGYEIATENYSSAQRSVELLAPITGRIARIDLDEGQIAFPGDVIMTIIANKKLEIKFNVVQEDRRYISQGQEVSVYVDGEESITGVITNVSLVTENDSRMFSVYARIPAVDGIYPGVMATVDVTLEEKKDILTVPVDALLNRSDKTLIVVVDGNIARIKAVEIGLRGENQVEVISGLNIGESVAVYGHTTLEDGVKVKVVQAEK